MQIQLVQIFCMAKDAAADAHDSIVAKLDHFDRRGKFKVNRFNVIGGQVEVLKINCDYATFSSMQIFLFVNNKIYVVPHAGTNYVNFITVHFLSPKKFTQSMT